MREDVMFDDENDDARQIERCSLNREREQAKK